MSLALMMDPHVPDAVTDGLRERGIDVLTAFEDGAAGNIRVERIGVRLRELVDADQLNHVVEVARAMVGRHAARQFRHVDPAASQIRRLEASQVLTPNQNVDVSRRPSWADTIVASLGMLVARVS